MKLNPDGWAPLPDDESVRVRVSLQEENGVAFVVPFDGGAYVL